LNSLADVQVHRGWRPDSDLLIRLRRLFTYSPGDDRATGYLYTEGEQPWPGELADAGPRLLADLDKLLGVRFPIVAFQAYLDGAGCGWHTDGPFDLQAVLSLGVARTFGTRRLDGPAEWIRVEHGDLVVMPSGFQNDHEHCVPVEEITGERCSLVFRTAVRS